MPRPTKSSMMAAAKDHMADQRREAEVALDRAIDRVANNLRKDLAANFAHQDVKRGPATPPTQPRVDDLIAVARRILVLIDTGALRQPEWEGLSLEAKRESQQQSIYDQAAAALAGASPVKAAGAPAYIVLQQGGTSLEWYIHSHDTEHDAENDIKECHSGAYNTYGPFTLPANPSEEDWYKMMEEVVAASHGASNVQAEDDAEEDDDAV